MHSLTLHRFRLFNLVGSLINVYLLALADCTQGGVICIPFIFLILASGSYPWRFGQFLGLIIIKFGKSFYKSTTFLQYLWPLISTIWERSLSVWGDLDWLLDLFGFSLNGIIHDDFNSRRINLFVLSDVYIVKIRLASFRSLVYLEFWEAVMRLGKIFTTLIFLNFRIHVVLKLISVVHMGHILRHP